MRKFARPSEPEVLKQNCEKWNKQWIALREKNPGARFDWYSADGRTAREHILPTLAEQTQRHCSFCDAFPIEGVSNETIEHFQPKSTFPHLAYIWHNLYYCCDACQSSKREDWNELLLRPDDASYNFFKYFEFDFTTGEIKPNSVADEAVKERAIVTIRLYGLNTYRCHY